MNKVILMGRLTRDPDIRFTQSENSMAIAKYTLAVDRRRTGPDGQRDADFINCTAFGKQAEFAGKYLHQGTKLIISGRIQTGSYENRDGQKVYTTDVIVEDQEFAESKSANDSRRSAQRETFTAPQAQARTYEEPQPQAQADEEPQAASSAYAQAEGEGFMNIPEGVEDEGLPFNFS